MQGYKKCSNGHFFKDTLSACPYCPEGKSGSSDSSDNGKTVVGGGGAPSTDLDRLKTEVYSNGGGTEGFSGDKTMVFTPGGNQSQSAGPKASGAAASDKRNQFDRTFIGGMPVGTSDNEPGKPAVEPRAARKIVGWIISYSIDPMGVDYRIFEGNNSIGREPSNSIILSKESTISGKHVTILYKAGKFWVKDEMSANGSFLNGVEMEIQKAYQMNDNDELRLGNTIFKFKSAE